MGKTAGGFANRNRIGSEKPPAILPWTRRVSRMNGADHSVLFLYSLGFLLSATNWLPLHRSRLAGKRARNPPRPD